VRKKQNDKAQRRGLGLAVGLAIGVMSAVATDNNGLFVIGIAIGAALESTYAKK
jgi:hypothetical protein